MTTQQSQVTQSVINEITDRFVAQGLSGPALAQRVAYEIARQFYGGDNERAREGINAALGVRAQGQGTGPVVGPTGSPQGPPQAPPRRPIYTDPEDEAALLPDQISPAQLNVQDAWIHQQLAGNNRPQQRPPVRPPSRPPVYIDPEEEAAQIPVQQFTPEAEAANDAWIHQQLAGNNRPQVRPPVRPPVAPPVEPPYAQGPLGQPEGQPYAPGQTPSSILQQARDFLSGSRGGRADLFGSYLAGSPDVQDLAPFARGLLQNSASPFGIQSVLNAFQNPGDTAGNYRDILGNAGIEGILGSRSADFSGMLQGLRGQGFLPGQGQGLSDFMSSGSVPAGIQSLLSELYGRNGDEDLARDFIHQSARQSINPLLRGGVSSLVNQKIQGFRDTDRETPLFRAFADRNFNFLGK